MDQHPHSFGVLVKQPSAYVPVAMSLTALALVLATSLYTELPARPMRGPLRIFGRSSWRNRFRYWLFRDQMDATGSKARARCVCAADRSGAGFDGAGVLFQFVMQNSCIRKMSATRANVENAPTM
jgi:hypothetical protein